MTRFAGAAFKAGTNSFMDDSPRYDKLGASAVTESAMGEANTARNEAEAANAVMRGQAMVESAEAQAEAIRAGGQAQGQASMVGGIAGGIGGLGKMFRSKSPSSGYVPLNGWGNFGSIRLS